MKNIIVQMLNHFCSDDAFDVVENGIRNL